MEYTDVISRALNATVNIEYGNVKEPIVKSISEIVRNEMQISLDNIKPNPLAFHTLCSSINRKINEKYKIGCSIMIGEVGLYGEYSINYVDLFALNYDEWRLLFACYAKFP
jgi:hypothetical protein